MGLPGPLRIGGYFRWAGKLTAGSIRSLFLPFVAGLLVIRVLHFTGVVIATAGAGNGSRFVSLTLFLVFGVVLTLILGCLLAGIASVVFVHRLTGTPSGARAGWNERMRPKLGNLVAGALYGSIPVMALLLLFGPFGGLVQVAVIPMLLGPPIFVQAVCWEGHEFRAAGARAKNLLAGHTLRVVVYMLLIALCAALVQIVVLSLVLPLLVELGGQEFARSAGAIAVDILTTSLVWMFVAAASTVAYLDLRSRSEESDTTALEGAVIEASRGAPTLG